MSRELLLTALSSAVKLAVVQETELVEETEEEEVEEDNEVLRSVPHTSDSPMQSPKIPDNPQTCYLLHLIYLCHYLKLLLVTNPNTSRNIPNTFFCLMYLN